MKPKFFIFFFNTAKNLRILWVKPGKVQEVLVWRRHRDVRGGSVVIHSTHQAVIKDARRQICAQTDVSGSIKPPFGTSAGTHPALFSSSCPALRVETAAAEPP